MILGKIFGRRSGQITFSELVPKFLESRRELNLRWVSLTNYRCFARTILRERADQPVDDFGEDDLRSMISDHSRSTALDMAVMLRWAFRKKLAAKDITRDVFRDVPLRDAPSVDYWSPSEAHAFYDSAHERHRAAFALGMFAGMRPYEIVRIRWESIDVVARKIRIEPSVSKVRRMRLIEGRPVAEGGAPTILWAQLMLHRQPSGFVFTRKGERTAEPTAVAQWLEARRETAKRAMVRLPRNIFRSSFATHYVALTGNPALAARILGHCDLGMLANHYDGVGSRRDAEDYFRPRKTLALPCHED